MAFRGKNVQDILFIPQVYNLEDELKRSTNAKNVLEITNSSSVKGFKRDLSMDCQLDKHLQKVNFDFHKFWSMRPDGQICVNVDGAAFGAYIEAILKFAEKRRGNHL